MNQFYTNKSQSTKITCEYYQKLLSQSTFIEQELSDFSSALAKSLICVGSNDNSWKIFTVKEMRDLKIRVWTMMSKIKEKIQRECSIIFEVTSCIKKLSYQFQQLNDVLKAEQERSSHNIQQLENHLRLKQSQISRSEKDLQSEKTKLLQDDWKRLHYIHSTVIDTHQIPGVAYAKILKDIKSKLQLQISNQKKQQMILNYNITNKLMDFKSKLLKVWYLLPYFPKDEYTFAQKMPSNSSSDHISELQRQYINKQKEIDQFEISKLVDIKRRLKLLEQADMSESREYLSYSHSIDQNLVAESLVEKFMRS